MRTKAILWPLLALSIISCGKETILETPEVLPTEQEVRDPWTLYPEEVCAIPGKTHSLVADCNTTKSQLVKDTDDSYSLSWTKGDQFIVIGTGPSQTLGATYTAENDGESTEFTTTNSLGESTEFHAIYPKVAFMTTGFVTINEEMKRAFVVLVPTSQTATPGSVAEETNISYAYSENLDNKLSFKNLVSYLKFKLSGDIIDQVTSVTLKGTSALAGGCVFYAPDGNPEILPNITGGFEKVNNITLSGHFEAGKEYFIALTPCVQEGLSMVFTDGTQTITKISPKTIRFDQSRITDFGTIKLGDHFTDTESTAPILYNEATAGAPKPVTLVVVPDGYTAAELSDYELKAKSGMEALLNTEPFKSYREYFNVWILKVASNESGASVTDVEGGMRDTYFGSKWNQNSYSGMSADDEKVFNFVTANCPDVQSDAHPEGTHSITEVPVLLIINDPRYGGISWRWTNGKTYCMVPTTAGNLRWGYPSQQAAGVNSTEIVNTTEEEYAEMGQNSGTWRNTLVHEFGGHSFAKLADEYWYDESKEPVTAISEHTLAVPFGLNISASPTTTPWDLLLQNKDHLTNQSPKYNRIGVYQGGQVSMLYRWRSEKISCMIDNRFYFSTWQRYLIVKRIRTLAGITEELTLGAFLNKDVPLDPVRDQVTARAIGVSDAVPPRPVPMLPPPVLVEE